MQIQYQMSNGMWHDAGERPDLVERAAKFNKMTVPEAIHALETGQILHHGTDWYDNIRSVEARRATEAAREAKRQANAPEMVHCDCGHTVPGGSVMSGNLGTVCPECYENEEY